MIVGLKKIYFVLSSAGLALQGTDHRAVLAIPGCEGYSVAVEAADGGVPGDISGHGLLRRWNLCLRHLAYVLRSFAGAKGRRFVVVDMLENNV